MIPTKHPTCSWAFIGAIVKFCPAPPTHYDQNSPVQFCREHAKDFEDVFGQECLREFPVEEPDK